jgi:hypothetical protein
MTHSGVAATWTFDTAMTTVFRMEDSKQRDLVIRGIRHLLDGAAEFADLESFRRQKTPLGDEPCAVMAQIATMQCRTCGSKIDAAGRYFAFDDPALQSWLEKHVPCVRKGSTARGGEA